MVQWRADSVNYEEDYAKIMTKKGRTMNNYRFAKAKFYVVVVPVVVHRTPLLRHNLRVVLLIFHLVGEPLHHVLSNYVAGLGKREVA
jgi:hypothetical protein